MKADWQNNFFSILFAAAVLHGLYLAILIALKPSKGNSLSYLSLTVIGITSLLCIYFFFISNAIVSFPNLLGVLTPLIYITGPAFYFFIRKSINTKFAFQKYDALHSIPIIYYGFQSWQIFIQPVEAKLTAIQKTFSQPPPAIVEIVLDSPFNIITSAYVIACIVFLTIHFKGQSNHSLQWLKKFSFVFLALLLAGVIIPIIFVLNDGDGAYLELTLTLMYAAAIHVLGYIILKKQFNISVVGPLEKYVTSPLDLSLIDNYKNKIIDHLENHKPWLEPDFSISDLSTQLSIPKHYLSQVLNEKVKMSFNDLVNAYRIAEVKNRLASGALAKYSVFGVAKDCGFASKSTFNRIFKKSTGLTPTAYILTIGSNERIGSVS